MVDEERCDRCGNMGHDRRTLWMAAMWQIETVIPAAPWVIYKIRGQAGRCVRKIVSVLGFPQNTHVPIFMGDRERTYTFYTLRVCKGCRGDWLEKQREWWQMRPDEYRHIH